MKNFIITVSLLAVLSGFSFPQQVIGKIYSKQEADSLYGPVLSSIAVNSNIISGLLKNSVNYIMFRIDNDTVYIAGNNRQPLSPEGFTVNSTDAFKVYSISLVIKLLQDGGSMVTNIETRKNGILSINNGEYILEFAAICPPFCY